MPDNYGASPEEWKHFSKTLGLTADILPVVSKPTAKISAASKMKSIGKTPSRYNGSGEIAGIADWTSKQSTTAEIAKWSASPDYGICLQTRTVRAFDIDVENPVISKLVLAEILRLMEDISYLSLPMRYRMNSSKFLLAFALPGELPKRVIRLKEGIIELLGSGQQFIACGTHTSGVKYAWMDCYDKHNLPQEFPSLTLKQVDAIWSTLEEKFAVAPSATSASPSKVKVLANAIQNDPVAQFLVDEGHVLSTEKDGRLHITCPFADGHSMVSADSSTTYFPANTGGYQFGHFDCKHASCEHRSDQDFKDELGIPYDDPLDDFDILPPLEKSNTTVADVSEIKKEEKPRFTVVTAADFLDAAPQKWIIKKILPQAELGVIYGESTAGKSFFALDLAGAISQGKQWRGHNVKQGTVIYVCAEGAGGMRGRVFAYCANTGIDVRDLRIGIIPDTPNLMEVSDVKSLLKAIQAFGEVSVIVVDTFAQVMAGANENSGEDVGKALKHCKFLHKHTGALVLLIHHAGKDTSKGARGWSGLRAAADVEIEIVRDGDDRTATITKLKDGSDGSDYGFKLNTVVIGVDEDLEEITSCVLEYTDKPRKARTQKVNAKGGNEKLVLQALESLLSVGDDRVSYHDLVVKSVSQLPYDESSGKRDRRRDLVSQAVSTLRDNGKLEVVDGAWLKLPGIKDEDLA